MTTPIANLLATVAGLASVAGIYGNAWADDTNTVPHAPAELARWHSVLTDTGGSDANPEWRSTLGAIDPGDSAEFRAAHGAIGLRNVTRYGFRYSSGSFDDPKNARRSSREPAGTPGSNAGTGR